MLRPGCPERFVGRSLAAGVQPRRDAARRAAGQRLAHRFSGAPNLRRSRAGLMNRPLTTPSQFTRCDRQAWRTIAVDPARTEGRALRAAADQVATGVRSSQTCALQSALRAERCSTCTPAPGPWPSRRSPRGCPGRCWWTRAPSRAAGAGQCPGTGIRAVVTFLGRRWTGAAAPGVGARPVRAGVRRPTLRRGGCGAAGGGRSGGGGARPGRHPLRRARPPGAVAVPRTRAECGRPASLRGHRGEPLPRGRGRRRLTGRPRRFPSSAVAVP